MTSERWRRIEQIYEDALQRAPHERAMFLESACAGDQTLRSEVERLIAANDRAGEFLNSPAWALAPKGGPGDMIAGDTGMSLVGQSIGHYRIVAPLGRGGMGDVYRAHDGKLNREVALKVLPDAFTRDPDRIARFKREAHVLASLNHPNIAAIYGFEDSTETHALVMELIEGPTLGDTRRALPLNEALPIARQIADALEAAHDRGIIHRDLKPANIKVRADGTVKVLDFGLAKALESPSRGSDPAQSPTITSPVATREGIILGTAAYMAPEQARGRPADKRSDLWAFGCVLYEMLTGRRAFAGQDTAETLAAVIKDDPDWTALPTQTPASIRRLLRRCLAKDPKARLSDAAAARIEIDEALGEPQIDAYATQTTSRRKERVAWASALLLVGAAAVAALVFTRRPEPVANEVRFDIQTPPTTDPVSLAISPDSQKIVFVATHEGRNRLWLRRLDSGSAEPLAGTDGAATPFWSPDSRSVAFFSSADNRLKRLDIDGRSLQVLLMFPLVSGGTWNQDGTILFSNFAGSSPILRISANGGQPAPATRLQPPELTHQAPQFLPDGRHFLYHSINLTPPAVFVGDLGGTESRRLLEADTAARYVPSGHLLFARGGTLFAQAFDADRVTLSGDPFRVAEHMAILPGSVPALSLSATSTLAYRVASSAYLRAPVLDLRPLVWFDRSGKEIGRLGGDQPGARPSRSPDGRQVAVTGPSDQFGPPDIWLIRLDRDVWTRFTSNGGINLDPIWSPDGKEVAFSSSLKTHFDLYRQRLDGTGKVELLLETPEDKMPSDWSRDGRSLLYGTYGGAKTGADIWALPLNGEKKPFPVVQTAFDEVNSQFSPDGRWIAYQSNETGQFEIYVQQFPGPGERQRISTAGGAQVRWRDDGRELFYVALDGRLMAVPIRFATGQPPDPGAAVPLFTTHIGGAVSGVDRQEYVVSPNGDRFLMSVVPEDPNPPPITVVLNWRPRPQN